jgi:hypothetical protein
MQSTASTPFVAQPLEGDEDVVGALHRRHAAESSRTRTVRARCRIRRLSARPFCSGATRSPSSIPSGYLEALWRRNAERNEVVAHLRAHGDQSRSCRDAEPALEQAEEPRAHGPK